MAKKLTERERRARRRGYVKGTLAQVEARRAEKAQPVCDEVVQRITRDVLMLQVGARR